MGAKGQEAQTELRKTLLFQLEELQNKNAAFSMRAYAKRLGISAAALSEILSGKRRVSANLAERLLSRSAIEPEQIQKIVRALAEKNGASKSPISAYSVLEIEQFKIISDWYHFAILSLIKTRDYRHDSKWIAARLGITHLQAAHAIARLEQLNLLRVLENGKVVRTKSNISTPDGVANLSLRKLHSQNLELAKHSLEQDDISLRDFTALSIAIDPELLPKAKELIREILDQFSERLESPKKTEVYKLCVQFFPLSRPINGESKP